MITVLIFIGVVAYVLKAMQPDGFLKFIPAYIKLKCNPCYAGWLSLLVVLIFDWVVMFFAPEYFLNPLLFMFIGASAHALFKFMES